MGPLNLTLERFRDHKFRPTGGEIYYYPEKKPLDLNGIDGFELTVLGQPLDIMESGWMLHTGVPLARIHRPYIMRIKDPETFAQGKFNDCTRVYGSDEGDLALVCTVGFKKQVKYHTWFFGKKDRLLTRFDDSSYILSNQPKYDRKPPYELIPSDLKLDLANELPREHQWSVNYSPCKIGIRVGELS